MRTTTRNECPVCKSPEAEVIAENRYYLRSLDSSVDQTHVLCPRCGFGYTANPADEAELETYYSTSTQERTVTPERNEREHAAPQLDFIEAGLRQAEAGVALSEMTVLELGPGNGAFLHELRDRGCRHVFFEEWNPQAAGHLRDAGFEDFARLPVEERGGKADMVAMNHCLEHIADLDAMLRSLRDMTVEGGWFYAEVPDFSLPGRDVDSLMFEHVNYFTLPSLTQLLASAGFATVSAVLAVDRNFAPCPKRVVRVLAQKLPDADCTPEGRRQLFLEGNERKIQAMKALDDWLDSIGPESRIALAPGSWLTEACLGATRLQERGAFIVFDRDEKKWGTCLGTLTIHDPGEVVAHAPDWLLILNEGYEQSIRQDYEALGIDPARIVGWSRFAGGDGDE